MNRFHTFAVVGLLTIVALGCQKPLPQLPPSEQLPEPDPRAVETVLFLIGDAGEAFTAHPSTLVKLGQEVDQWASAVTRDSGVYVVFLGDNVYPRGLRDANDPGFPQDSINLMAQVNLLSSAAAQRVHARGVFLSGNHDWGQAPAPGGLVRVKNEHAFLERRQREGHNVIFLPAPGTPAPAVLDIGTHLRLVIVDTAWWLLGSDAAERTKLLSEFERALRGRKDRFVVVASHHPWESASEHGGLVPIWQSLGVRYLLSRSGAWLQDLNSIPYRQFKDAVKATYARTGNPLIHVGGHDHALQVITANESNEPRVSLVSGAASKTSKVGFHAGMTFRDSGPGYMRVMFMKDGSVLLFVTASSGAATCVAADSTVAGKCEEFRTAYTMRVR